jgi:Flp pilus assembly protein TadD
MLVPHSTMHAARAIAVAVMLALASAGPSSARGPIVGPHKWAEEVRERGLDPAEVVNPLETTPAMRALAAQLGRGSSQLQQLTALQSALFDTTKFTFDYEGDVSLTAREAFLARRGNCVAFTNLFIALGRSLGVPVRAALLRRDPDSEREGDLVLVNTHVVAVYPHAGRVAVYDFYRQRQADVTGIRYLDDLGVSAVFHNNRAVARLKEGDLRGARHELEITTRLAPDFAAAHANLGVVLRRMGDTPGAFDAYRKALELAPHDPTTLANLAALYGLLGREREARLALESANMKVAAPHTLLVRGDLEAADGEYARALRLYRRAGRLLPKAPAPLVAIARVERARNRPEAARRAVERALALAPDDAEALALRQDIPARRR